MQALEKGKHKQASLQDTAVFLFRAEREKLKGCRMEEEQNATETEETERKKINKRCPWRVARV